MAPFSRNQVWQWEYISESIGAEGLGCQSGWQYGFAYHERDQYSIRFNGTSVYRLDHETGEMIQVLDNDPYTSAHNNHILYDPVGERLIMPFFERPQFTPRNYIWEWDDVGKDWIDVTPAGTKPGSRANCKGALDPTTNQVYFFSGSGSSWPGQETWVFDLASWTWAQLSPSVSPPAGTNSRGQHGMAYCPLNNCVYCLGGSAVGVSYRDLWRLEADRSTWTDITPSIITTDGDYTRFHRPYFEWLPSIEAFLIIGGHDNFILLEDIPVSTYDPITNVWTKITSQCIDSDVEDTTVFGGRYNPMHRGQHGGLYDIHRDLFIIGSGRNYTFGGHNNPGFWTLTPVVRPRETSQITNTFIIAKDAVRFRFTNALSANSAYFDAANYAVQNLSTGETMEVKQVLPINGPSTDILSLHLQKLIEGDTYQLTIAKETLSTVDGDLIAELDDTLEVWTQTKTKVDSTMGTMSRMYDLKIGGTARGLIEATGITDEEIGGKQGEN